MWKTTILSLAVASAALVTPALAAESLIIAHYGGIWGKTIETCIMEPFTKATGIGIILEPGGATVNRSKILQQKSSPVIDVVWIDGGISELALADGTIATLDLRKIPNLANVIDEGLHKRKDGTIYAVSTGFWAIGLIYNTKEVNTAPTSWNDLWKKEYEGKISMPSVVNNAGLPVFLAVNKMEGGDIKNVEPGVKKLKALKVVSYYDSSGAAAAIFSSGEAIIGALYSSGAWDLVDKGLPFAYVIPKEGAPAGDIRVHIVEGTKKKEAAEQFVNFAVSKEAATCMVDNLYVGTATKGVTPSEKAKQRLPWGPNGSVKSLNLINFNEVNANRERLNEIWNKQVVGGK